LSGASPALITGITVTSTSDATEVANAQKGKDLEA